MTPILLPLCIAVSVSTPFHDTQDRFSLHLPDGWKFAPQPGDVHGATFSRDLDGIPASAAVRVVDLSAGGAAADLARHVAEASRHEPGYEMLINDTTTLSGRAAHRHRFVIFIAGNPKWSKMVEQRVTVIGKVGYVLHVETVAPVFGTFEKEFERLFDGFRAGPTTKKTTLREKVPLPKTAPDRERVVGKWAGAGHELHLSPSGVVLLDEDHGRYRVAGGVIILRFGKRRAHLRYDLSADGKTLRVSGGRFGEGKTLKRR